MYSAIRYLGVVAACATSMLAPSPSSAVFGQPGTLDTTWAASSPLGAGKAANPVGIGSSIITAVALQPDGNLLAVGRCQSGPAPARTNICAARYLPSGLLDTSWNSTGTVITPIGGTTDSIANAVTLQPDGKALLAGMCHNGTNLGFCAVRYNPDGTLDTTWNGTGIVSTSIGSASSIASSVILQSDGKVLLAGSCTFSVNLTSLCVARYLPGGTLDTSWNVTGTVVTPVGGTNDIGRAMALQPDGKILLGGTCSNGSFREFCTVRYDTSGALDLTWNGTGKAMLPVVVGIDNYVSSVALQPDGKILLGGLCASNPNTNADFCSARFKSDGTLDFTWNGTGKVVTSIGINSDAANTIALQPDGKILMGGYCAAVGGGSNFCAVRYLINGALDTTWNGTGIVITPMGLTIRSDLAYAMALEPDGKVLLAGGCFNGGITNFCVARYDAGPFGFCTLDVDGDGSFLATTDALIITRIGLGVTGAAVINGITFPPTATRNTWPLIRNYLVTQCGMSLPP